MSAPVKMTCPDIDKIIKSLRSALRTAEHGLKNFKGEDCGEYFKDIEYDLDGLEWELEDLRKSNASLREWGDDLENQLEIAANEINDLENKLEESRLVITK